MGCAVETSKSKRRRKCLSTARPYGELSEAAQVRAREVWREKGWTWDEHDSEQLTETFREELWEKYGIEGADVNWSLGWCQGDGVAFAATPNIQAMAEHDQGLRQCIDAAEVLLAMQGADDEADWGVQITHAGRCYGWGGMQVSVECRAPWGNIDPIQDVLDGIAARAAEIVCQIVQGACKHLERLGYREIEYCDSDECIAETLDANDYARASFTPST